MESQGPPGVRVWEDARERKGACERNALQGQQNVIREKFMRSQMKSQFEKGGLLIANPEIYAYVPYRESLYRESAV